MGGSLEDKHQKPSEWPPMRPQGIKPCTLPDVHLPSKSVDPAGPAIACQKLSHGGEAWQSHLPFHWTSVTALALPTRVNRGTLIWHDQLMKQMFESPLQCMTG